MNGLSPRVRGNQCCLPGEGQRYGSIPACAGEPYHHPAPVSPVPVYPRVCGGTRFWYDVWMLRRGLSPRVRGNRRRDVPALRSRGSIPACAGEPCTGLGLLDSWAVYPRVCGGTVDMEGPSIQERGLSPRVRGNPRTTPRTTPWTRSIPACAGEPRDRELVNGLRTVYPRVCGGTWRMVAPTT